MKLVTVVPITKGVFKDSLTYFSSKDILVGSLVYVPIRSRDTLSLVTETRDISQAKAELKSLAYELKKIKSIKGDATFSPAFLKATEDTAKHFLCNTGHVLEHFTSKVILENLDKIKTKQKIGPIPKDKEGIKIEKLVTQNLRDERMDYYKGLIRESFATKNSIVICLPTINSVELVFKNLEKGISDYSVKLHSELKKSTILEQWLKIIETKHPLLIITTPQFLSLNRPDIKTIIIDEENSRVYKQNNRPFIDTRFFAERLAERMNAKFILGDTVLRVETFKRLDDKELSAGPSIKHRLFSPSESFVVENKKTGDKKHLPTLSSDMEEFLVFAKKQKERTFLLCGRKGLYPNTICGDCGKPIICANCDNHLSISADFAGLRNFVCYKCGRKYEVSNKCDDCGSWNLVTLGSGIENVKKEIEKLLGKDNVFQIDSGSTKTTGQANKVIKSFLESKDGVLIGTEKALSHLNEPVENTGALFVDSWFSIPDFSIKEKIMKNIVLLQGLAKKRFIIQTRSPEESVFKYGTKGMILEFYKEELSLREKLKYPPYCRLIKVRVDRKNFKNLEQLKERLIKINPKGEYFVIEDAGNKTSVLILKLLLNDDLEKTVRMELPALPPSFTVNVDPENIL